ncbi:hypothetical protein HAZT_HAZT006807 [Hyalella azteca]|uniref:Uncharacterized protein n=1 Tax=Hyalella azteca TaxID=294128 RepID=A0A6A0GZM6_HYAAZ|nr:hypothetical protein HAZT_HAZT006807 [Hyalella azteca]
MYAQSTAASTEGTSGTQLYAQSTATSTLGTSGTQLYVQSTATSEGTSGTQLYAQSTATSTLVQAIRNAELKKKDAKDEIANIIEEFEDYMENVKGKNNVDLIDDGNTMSRQTSDSVQDEACIVMDEEETTSQYNFAPKIVITGSSFEYLPEADGEHTSKETMEATGIHEACDSESKVFDYQPKASDCESKAFDKEPKAFDCQPKAYDCEPKAFDCEPKAFDCEPKAFDCESLDKQLLEPKINRKEILPDFSKIADVDSQRTVDDRSTYVFESLPDRDDGAESNFGETDRGDEDATVYFSIRTNGIRSKSNSFSADEEDIDLLRKVGIIKTDAEEKALRSEFNTKQPSRGKFNIKPPACFQFCNEGSSFELKAGQPCYRM